MRAMIIPALFRNAILLVEFDTRMSCDLYFIFKFLRNGCKRFKNNRSLFFFVDDVKFYTLDNIYFFVSLRITTRRAVHIYIYYYKFEIIFQTMWQNMVCGQFARTGSAMKSDEFENSDRKRSIKSFKLYIQSLVGNIESGLKPMNHQLFSNQRDNLLIKLNKMEKNQILLKCLYVFC